MVAYLQKSKGSEGFHQIVDFLNTCHIKYALIENPTIYVSLIEQFWQTATARTLENGDMEITATIDGKVKIVSEASIRRHLKLEDSDGISDLPTTEIFEQLALIGYGEGSTIPVESHHTPTVAPSTSQPHHSPTLRDFIRQETKVPQPSSPTQTHVADEVVSTGVDDRHREATTTVSGLEAGQGSGNIHKTATMPYDSPLPRVHIFKSEEGRMQQNELMDFTELSDRVAVLENDLKQTKKTYGAAFTKLIKKGRKIAEIDEDLDISLVQQMIQRQEYDLEPNFNFTAPEEVYTAPEEVYTAKPDISTANVPVSTAGAEVSTVAERLVYIRRSAAKRKDKGKATVEESEPTQTKTKIQQEQERLGFEEAQRLQEQFNKEERQRIASFHEEASTFKPEEWDNIQAQVKADEELAHRLQAQERERYSEDDKAKLLHIGSHTLQQLRGYSFDEIKVLFKVTVKRVNTFTPMESDDTVPKFVAGSSKRSAEEELGEESSKRQKIGEGSKPAEESKDKESDELERFSSTEPIDDKERALWVELKRLFEPDTDDLLELQRYMHDPLTWRLYDTCGIHHVSTETGLDIFMLVEKDYPLTRGLPMLMLVNKLQVDQHSEMADELLRKIFILANRPRH
ncbi:hypothetical protein Tco_0180521 [Tanacetum coccineum]